VRSARVELILDTLRAVRGAKDLSKAVDGVAEGFKDTTKEGAQVGKAVDDAGGEMTDAALAAGKLDREIEKLTGSLKQMAIAQALSGTGEFDKQIRQQETQIRRLTRSRKLFGDLGAEAAPGFALSFSQRLGPLIASGPASAAVGTALGLAMGPTAAAAISGAIVGGAGVGGVVGGIIVASRDARVKSAAKDLGDRIMDDLNRKAGQFVAPMLTGISQVRSGWNGMGQDLDRIFASSRFVQPLTKGLLSGGRALVGGIADAVEEADPVIQSFADGFDRIGTATGEAFTMLSANAGQGAAAIDELTASMSNLITVSAHIVDAAATVKGWSDELDIGIDKGRYWMEQHAGFAGEIDLTADGFARGTKEADAYQRMVTGVGTTADVTALRLAGMTDSEIRSADATGELVAETDALNRAASGAGSSAGILGVKVEDTGKKVEIAAQKFVALNDQIEATIDRNLSAAEAQIQLREATKNAADAVDKKSKVSDKETSALIAMARATNSTTKTLDEQGRTVGQATAAHEANRKKLYETARAMGYGKAEAKKLANQYLATPKGVTTKITQPGMKTSQGDVKKYHGQLDKLTRTIKTNVSVHGDAAAYRKLERLLVAQQAAKKGISVSAAQSAFNKNAKGFHGGGYTGPGAKMQPAGIVHADEFVVKKESRRRIERSNPGLLDELNATGQLPGHAAGGMVMPVRVNASMTKVISMAEALSKVAPAFGSWPSSPGAQRGDSGVWRKVLQLIRSGPKMGSFGNAYRPGDPKWHGSGRAVDWMGYNMDPLARYLASKRPLELIHRTRNRDYAYTRGRNMGSFNAALMNAHRNHIHIAMANGGVIPEPVMGVGRSGATYSFAERGPERVLSAGQTAASAGAGRVVTMTLAPVIHIHGSNLSPQQISAQVNREIGAQFNQLVRGIS
jgi:hypothetical protein